SNVVAMLPAPAHGTQRPTSERSRTGSTGAGRWTTGGEGALNSSPWVSTTGTGPQRPRSSSTTAALEPFAVSAGVTSTAGRSHAIQAAASSVSVVPRTAAGPNAVSSTPPLARGPPAAAPPARIAPRP